MKKIFKFTSAILFAIALGIGGLVSFHSSVSAEGSNPYVGGWTNCTWSAWQLVYESTGLALPRWGNGGEWGYNAANDGYYVSSIPAANTIAVWSNHVAYVTDVSEDGQSVYIREGGWGGTYNEGWIPSTGVRSSQTLIGYIYLGGEVPATYYRPSDLSTPTSPEEAARQADQARMVQEEEQKVIKVEDVSKTETLKTDEILSKEQLSKEDKSSTTLVTVK